MNRLMNWYFDTFWFELVGYTKTESGSILFYMTKSGRRRLEFIKPYVQGHIGPFHRMKVNAELWRRGGPFPDGFTEAGDAALDFLKSIVDKKLGVRK